MVLLALLNYDIRFLSQPSVQPRLSVPDLKTAEAETLVLRACHARPPRRFPSINKTLRPARASYVPLPELITVVHRLPAHGLGQQCVFPHRADAEHPRHQHVHPAPADHVQAW